MPLPFTTHDVERLKFCLFKLTHLLKPPVLQISSTARPHCTP
jgi:hypothetical protein